MSTDLTCPSSNSSKSCGNIINIHRPWWKLINARKPRPRYGVKRHSGFHRLTDQDCSWNFQYAKLSSRKRRERIAGCRGSSPQETPLPLSPSLPPSPTSSVQFFYSTSAQAGLQESRINRIKERERGKSNKKRTTLLLSDHKVKLSQYEGQVI